VPRDLSPTEYFSDTALPYSAYPITVHLTFTTNVTSPANGTVVFSTSDFSGGGGAYSFLALGLSSTNEFRLSVFTGGTGDTIDAGQLTAGVWYSGTFVILSATERYCYLDAVQSGSASEPSRTFPGSQDRTTIGGLLHTSQINAQWDGHVGPVFVWDAGLVQDEVTQLHNGVIVRPLSLQPWRDMEGINTDEINRLSTLHTLAVTGTPVRSAEGPATIHRLHAIPSYIPLLISQTETSEVESLSAVSQPETTEIESKGVISQPEISETESLSAALQTETTEAESISAVTQSDTSETESLSATTQTETTELESKGSVTQPEYVM